MTVGSSGSGMRIIKTVVNLPQLPDNRFYDYAIPSAWEEAPRPGMRILVPFGPQRAEAVVWAHATESPSPALREIIEVLDEEPILNQKQRQLIDWMAEKFFCRRLDLLRLFLPPGLKVATEKCWKLETEWSPSSEIELTKEVTLPEEVTLPSKAALLSETLLSEVACASNPFSQEVLEKFQAKFSGITTEYTKLPELDRKEQQILSHLVRAGVVRTGWLPKKQGINVKTVQAYKVMVPDPAARGIKLTPKQETVYAFLAKADKAVPATRILAATGVSAGVLTTLTKKGVLEKTQLTVARDPFLAPPPSVTEPPPKPNPEQENALRLITDALQEREAKTFLLHGVTGSGKTEVYLRAIEETLKRGKKAIYLVPEISLTPQTVRRVRARFGEDLAILHSSLAAGERFDQWWKIKRGEVKVVVGARSALFAPVSDLGLIIMDEEHEYTYKQEETPRYHSREVAKKISRLTGSPLILGSATPALESYYQADTGEIQKIPLSRRVMERALPEIRLIDLRAEFKAKRFAVLSPPLVAGIEEALSRKEQVILLLNRRGYATFINCRECGHVIKCPSCDVTLTFHQRPNVLRCHYCDYKEKPPDLCPHCRSHYIRYFGKGTQRLEEELQERFPLARTVRMDLDSTGRKGSHERIYSQLVQGEVDILVGTQMVAKGLDLPRVTLVGVIAADTALGLPDFRSAERTYQILTQAAGRAGRGAKPGLVYIQTFNPEHYSIAAVAHQNEEEFYRKELGYRQAGDYPPFTNLIRLVFSGGNKRAVIKAALEITGELKKTVCSLASGRASICTNTKKSEEPSTPTLASASVSHDMVEVDQQANPIQIIGPNPAAIEKVQDRYRWQTLIKTPDLSVFYQPLPEIIGELRRKKHRAVRIIIDENPYSML